MVPDESIRTQFDDLVAAMSGSGGRSMSIGELAQATGLSNANVMKWLSLLEKSGQVHIENRLSGVRAKWVGEPARTQPEAEGTVDASASSYSAEPQIELARQLEDEARQEMLRREEEAEADKIKLRHKVVLQSADEELSNVGEKIEKIGSLISKLKKRQKEAKPKEAEPSVPEEREAPAPEVFGEPVSEEPEGEMGEEPARIGVPEEAEAAEAEPERPLPVKIGVAEEEETLVSEPAIKIRPVLPRRKVKIRKIVRPQPMQPTAVSLQFSEKLSRHVRKITAQTQEIGKLKMEKEKLLAEHYLPMQRKLEVEIETISDRVLKMEKNILAMQQRASELPDRVQVVEKLQIETIKAHAEMRKAYDEAAALVEEAASSLAEEREKMALMVEQSRQEIAGHRAKSEELEGTILKISQMEEQAALLVQNAREALAEQAERLASAEENARELSGLKEEIAEGVASAKREMAGAKSVLTSLEKQMGQIRKIELWAGSIREDYEKKMLEIDDYIRNGNEEFETLRESVEANFVRRYLRELRQLTDSYSFELGQVKNAEANVDERIAEQKRKLDDLLEEGRKISYLYEMQSREPEGAGKFEQRGEQFRSIGDIAAQRTELEQMIAQVVGKRSEYQPDRELAVPRPKAKTSRASFKRALSKAGKEGKGAKKGRKGMR